MNAWPTLKGVGTRGLKTGLRRTVRPRRWGQGEDAVAAAAQAWVEEQSLAGDIWGQGGRATRG